MTRAELDAALERLGRAVREGERDEIVAAARLIEDMVAGLDGGLHSFIRVLADAARHEARAAETEIAAGTYRGPLHGIPIGLKDIYETAGVATTGHSKVMQHHVSQRDAFSVRRLREAGHRWTNERFLSTPHRVRNVSGEVRYVIPFFCDPDHDTMLECLPSCHSADNPAKYPPIRFGDYALWYARKSYEHIANEPGPPDMVVAPGARATARW